MVALHFHQNTDCQCRLVEVSTLVHQHTIANLHIGRQWVTLSFAKT